MTIFIMKPVQPLLQAVPDYSKWARHPLTKKIKVKKLAKEKAKEAVARQGGKSSKAQVLKATVSAALYAMTRTSAGTPHLSSLSVGQQLEQGCHPFYDS